MKKLTRFISAILTVLMVLGSVVIVSAADPAYDNYLTAANASEQAKLDKMTLERTQNGYELYCDEYSGEIALKKISTGQVLFSNPYDVGTSNASDDVKAEVLSQVLLTYRDSDDTEKDMNSYEEAVLRNQVIVKKIRNGIRVEYTMGRQEARRLVPKSIQKNRFEDLILNLVNNEFYHTKLKSYYVLMDPDDPDVTERQAAQMKAKFPITNRMAVYLIQENVEDKELDTAEEIIKTYAPEYTYEQLDYDHALTEYTGTDSAPPLFRLALEYTLSETGMEVRLPANGIRYDDTAYKLSNVSVLPYMGALANDDDGYTFIPDGSGALINPKDIAGQSWTRECTLYGPDYAYQQQTVAEHQRERATMPVWGAVSIRGETTVKRDTGKTDPETGAAITESVTMKNQKGFVAIITEGDSLATVRYVNGGVRHKYATTYPVFVPRPSDQYNLSESIAAASNTSWTVESPRKYVGSYRIQYVMLDGDDYAANAGLSDYYSASYFGMADAYRDYLEKEGIITRLTTADVKANIPLYIEALGTLQTEERVMSIPVTVDTPLTTFEDIETMYDEFSAQGIDNVNFKLIGFANGGLSDMQVPYGLKWEKAVGGSSGFEDLVDYAKEKGFGVYPDFDLAYAPNDKMFDGFSYSKHAVKTIDDRYTSKRHYDSATQSLMRRFEIAISPAYFDRFYTKLSENYMKYEPTSISFSTLGTDLNSDFDEDEPYNREDNKQFTTDLLEKISNEYANVMVDGGNAYTYRYVDHITNMTFESSKFFNASYSIPFNGLVLHGFINMSGTPINEEGDIESALLRAIESGSYLNFVLAYQNYQKLKEDEHLSEYYSVRYDIWFSDIVEYYNIINDAIGDLQTAIITGHELLTGSRIPDPDEVEADNAAIAAAQEEYDEAQRQAEIKAQHAEALAARKAAEALEREIEAAVDSAAALIEDANALLEKMTAQQETFNTAMAELEAAKVALGEAEAAVATATAAVEPAQAALDAAKAAIENAAEDADMDALNTASRDAQTALDNANKAVTDAQSAYDKQKTDYETTYANAVKASEQAATVAEGIATITESADHLSEITAESDNHAAVEANLATVRNTLAQVQTIADAIANAAANTLPSYELKEPEEDSGEEGDETEPADTDTTEEPVDTTEEPADTTEEPADTTEPADTDTTEEPADTTEPADTEEPEEPGDSEEPEEPEGPIIDVTSKYIVDDGSIVLVTYETGKAFILNYNSFSVKVEVDGSEYTVEPYAFVTVTR